MIARMCAHCWFDDIVTIKWWDDLWLTQGFAAFMSYYCLEGIKDQVTTIPTFSSAWKMFLPELANAFKEDQFDNTHPVKPVDQVSNTSMAAAYSDSISSAKGLAVLKQLMFIIGEQNFLKGITNYLGSFAQKTVTTNDFLEAIRPYFIPLAPDYTLDVWNQMWLESSGVNVLRIEWDPQSVDPKATLNIYQASFANRGPLRFHLINITYFYSDLSSLTQQILVNKVEKTTISYDASKKVSAILLNGGLYGYANC